MRDMAKRFLLLVLGLLVSLPSTASAQVSSLQSSPFVLPAGLEPAVEFWKKVFSEVSLSQLIYFDPSDMSKIYEVVDVGEDSRSNDYINGERARIAAANGVDIERVKAQRGVKERTAAGIKRSGRYISQIKQIFKDRGFTTGTHLSADRGIVLRHERAIVGRRSGHLAVHAPHRTGIYASELRSRRKTRSNRIVPSRGVLSPASLRVFRQLAAGDHFIQLWKGRDGSRSGGSRLG